MNEAIVAAVAAIFGGAGLKFIEYFITRSHTEASLATQLRQELRDDIARLRDQVEELREDRDNTRKENYDAEHGYQMLRLEMTKTMQLLARAVQENSEYGCMTDATKQEIRDYLDKKAGDALGR